MDFIHFLPVKMSVVKSLVCISLNLKNSKNEIFIEKFFGIKVHLQKLNPNNWHVIAYQTWEFSKLDFLPQPIFLMCSNTVSCSFSCHC